MADQEALNVPQGQQQQQQQQQQEQQPAEELPTTRTIPSTFVRRPTPMKIGLRHQSPVLNQSGYFDTFKYSVVSAGRYKVHDGWIHLKEGHGLNKWKKRWCILSERKFVYLYKSQKDMEPLTVIDLDTYCVVAGPDQEHKTRFQIKRQQTDQSRKSMTAAAQEDLRESYEFRSDKESEATDWSQRIRRTVVTRLRRPTGATRVLRGAIAAPEKPEPTMDGRSLIKYRNLSVKVLDCKDLPAMDVGGASDPYVVLNIGSEQFRTRTQFETLAPVWNENFDVDISGPPSELTIYVTVWDEDKYTTDDLIGKVDIAVNDCLDQKMKDFRLNLLPIRSSEYVSGDVHLIIQKDCELAGPNAGKAKLSIEIVEARNLAPKDANGYSDPYVMVYLGSHKRKEKRKTKTRKKTLFPVYKEQFEFHGIDEQTDGGLLIVEVWDKDRFKDDFMGRVAVDLVDLEFAELYDVWYRLTSISEEAGITALAQARSRSPSPRRDPIGGLPAENNASSAATAMTAGTAATTTSRSRERTRTLSNDLGSIRFQVQYTEETILPLNVYDGLLELAVCGGMPLLYLMPPVSRNYSELASALIQIAYTSNPLNGPQKTLDVVITSEIEQTPNPDIIFRGNTLTTKAVEKYIFMVGKSYLKEAMAPFIKDIYAITKGIEVDPMKIDKKEDIKKNFQHLVSLCTSLINRIFESAAICPVSIRRVLHLIQSKVMESYSPEQIKVTRYTAVSGFLFLRFFNVGLMSPHKRGLADVAPSPKVARACTLVAKTIQNLSNLATFGKKEPFMNDMNLFIHDNMDRMKTFIDHIATVPDDSHDVPDCKEPQNISLPKAMACVYRQCSMEKEKLVSKFQGGPRDAQLQKLLGSLITIDEYKKAHDIK